MGDSNNKTSWNKFVEILKQIPVVLGILVTLFSGVSIGVNIYYQKKCETFYGLPKEYFSTNINELLVQIGIIILLCLILLSPKGIEWLEYRLKKHEGPEKPINNDLHKDSSSNMHFYTIVVAAGFGGINSTLLVSILSDLFTIAPCAFYVIIFVGLALFWFAAYKALNIFFVMDKINFKKIEENEENEEDEENKNKVGNIVFYYLALFATIVPCIVFFYMNNPLNPTNKTVYEFVEMEDGSQYVILTTTDDKDLVVKYREVDEVITFYTRDYFFFDKKIEGVKYHYSYTGVPIINFEDTI